MEKCDELIISFLFPPANYISGLTVSKRIIENNNMVDVLHSKNLESKHNSFSKSVDDLISKRILVDVDGDVDRPDFIFKFINEGLKAIKNDYDKIYSRSWPLSNHFLACEYKFRHDSCHWTAEFSDPLMFDTSNNMRDNKNGFNDEFIKRINEQIKKLDGNFPLVESNHSIYFITEYIVYLFADQIIFTNENQRYLMLKQFPVDVKDYVVSKSVIKPHPTLPDKYYHMDKSKLKLNDDYINIAYFGGDYYGQRHFEGLFYALESLNHKYKDKLRLYIFINDKKLLKRLISTLTFKNNIKIKKPLSYLKFLNATSQFDVLIVNDLNTKDNFEINPYLPSKLSDYLGSSSDIWAISEKGSTLSKVNTKYNSDINDYSSSLKELVKILHDNGFIDEEYSTDEYYVKRLTSLNELYEKEFRKNIKLKKQLKELKSKKRFKFF